MRLGLRQVDGLTEQGAQSLLSARQERAFADAEDLVLRARLDRKDREALAAAWKVRDKSFRAMDVSTVLVQLTLAGRRDELPKQLAKLEKLADGIDSKARAGEARYLADASVAPHLYGKTARPGRKIGHVNVTAATEAERDAKLAALRAVIEAVTE